jgi:hypothetical protein
MDKPVPAGPHAEALGATGHAPPLDGMVQTDKALAVHVICDNCEDRDVPQGAGA